MILQEAYSFVGYFDSGTFNIKTGKVECSDESVTTYYFGDPQSDHMEYTLYVPAQVMPDMTLQLSNGRTSYSSQTTRGKRVIPTAIH